MSAFYPRKAYVVDFSKKIGYKWMIEGNRLIVLNYSHIFFEYNNFSDNMIERIETKSLEGSDHKGEHNNFVAIFTFAEPLNSGTLTYTTTKW